ncbi:cob(I)yrinic acid a,c-diamide adenosyltransferase [Hydrogenispora ethanolica]|uniref:Cob(I)yrinic acid a,c-diamide adenosyltransferase n=1 Tax=Hydrogenispora ethanolica TaxID=1082276 RepID=A0A4R1S4P5_HYDET|nr:cob(I)yrinic acid a,c-diamide adenosyltransferase [Hydrogenispora ethanolica]TCL74079.1 cob(I)yrinic acid a,c-diamide adenosyltransferase [Hydrogenispora ethanolica]
MEKGIIQVYTGDGKGKTTAAVGQAVRAHGRGLRVIIFQLLKAADGTGEQSALAALNPPLPFQPLGSGQFIFKREATPEEIAQAEAGWEEIRRAIRSGAYDLIVIDEFSHALNKKLLPPESVLEVLREKPAGLELVLTGRNMPEAVLELADLVTEMRLIKHPYQKGIGARKGIEY